MSVDQFHENNHMLFFILEGQLYFGMDTIFKRYRTTISDFLLRFIIIRRWNDFLDGSFGREYRSVYNNERYKHGFSP